MNLNDGQKDSEDLNFPHKNEAISETFPYQNPRRNKGRINKNDRKRDPWRPSPRVSVLQNKSSSSSSQAFGQMRSAACSQPNYETTRRLGPHHRLNHRDRMSRDSGICNNRIKGKKTTQTGIITIIIRQGPKERIHGQILTSLPNKELYPRWGEMFDVAFSEMTAAQNQHSLALFCI